MNYRPILLDCGFIALVWLLAIFVVHPSGNFPLNDDWAYATDVKNFLETGIFNPIGWTSMSLFAHVLWGALWCAIFGFSFEILRVSTLVISLICLWNIYLIGRTIGASRFLSLLLAFNLAFNPIYFALSFTFMTEISFLAFVSFAALFFVLFLKNKSIVAWCLAIVFCIIASLSRQTGLFLPLAFLFIFGALTIFEYWIKIKKSHKPLIPYLLLALLPFLFSFAALKYFESHMFATGKIQALYGLQVDELKYLLLNVAEILPLRVVKNMYQASLYLGLMGLPIWLFLAWRVATNNSPESSGGTGSRRIAQNSARATIVGRGLLLFFPFLFLIGVLINDSQMPTLVGILEVSGIGPRTLHDAYFLQISSENLPGLFWKIVTYASALGAGLIWALFAFGILFLHKKEKNNTWGTGAIIRQIFWKYLTNHRMGLFFLLSAAIYFAPFALVGFYDRYLLPLMMVLPLGVVGIFLPSSSFEDGLRMRKTFVIFLLILMAIFSITATHDYLARNRAKWQAIHDLTIKEHIPTRHIDGGFEFGGWYNFHEIEVEMDVEKSWWWVAEDDYILTFNEIEGYNIHSTYKYHSWWYGERYIFVLMKICP